MMVDRDSKLLDYKALSQLLSVPVSTLYAWVHLRRIPFIRFSSRFIRFDPEKIEAWLREREQGPDVPGGADSIGEHAGGSVVNVNSN